MKATEARALTRDSLTGPAIDGWLKHIHAKIEAAAKSGSSSITHPLMGTRGVAPNHQQQRAIWASLTADGYDVTHHPDPDPGDPRGGAYTEISW